MQPVQAVEIRRDASYGKWGKTTWNDARDFPSYETADDAATCRQRQYDNDAYWAQRSRDHHAAFRDQGHRSRFNDDAQGNTSHWFDDLDNRPGNWDYSRTRYRDR